MPRGGQSRGSKRKRNWDVEYPSFPGESPLQCRRAGLRTVGAEASLSEAWLRCGEGFQETPETLLSLTAEKTTTTEKHLELSSGPKTEPTTSKSTSGLTAITWSSSGSDLSDEDKTIFKSQRENGHGSRIGRFYSRNIFSPEDGASEDDLQVIDWEIDSDREDPCDEFEDRESVVEISDHASCTSSRSLTPPETLPELPKTNPTEILEYSSDSEKDDESENVLFIDSESSHKYHVDFGSDGRQVMERPINPRVQSTEAILHTPQKETKLPKTPESSAKKKKLLRGGLAERLNGLQNRERSAVSLWRHQYLSYQRTLSGIKSGILTVKILELHEECTIQVAMCEQLSGLQADNSSQGGAPGTGLRVLFAKETARCLRGLPQDIIHIYPPWQKLIIPNGSCPVILNTYFCQKVVAKEDSKTTHEVHSWDTPLPRRSIILAQMFRFQSLTNNAPENQVMCGGHTTVGTDWTLRPEQAELGFPARAPLRDSLLDAVESQGVATWSGAGVRVVVQRVYSLRCRCQQADGTDPPGVRVCLLVQDALGLFSEVHSEGAVLKDRELEGKSCRLAGMKVLQKVTRGRMTELFSLIDTMWPPVAPLKAPGHGPAFEEKTHLPPPSFCYILTAHPNLGQIDAIEEDSISKLYQPPIPRSLREILQTDGPCTRCSFYARVIYQRPQGNSSLLEPRELWLVVTDVTLQTQDEGSGLPKTMPVRVAPSCVLGQEVRDTLSEATSKSFFFRDALRDQGQLVCVGRTVLLLPKPHLGVASGAWELTSPVRLDELDSVTRVNSICSVQGAVVAVDESTACSWPACDLCGGERLERRPEDRGAFSCGDCSRVVTSPLLRRHLQVFLDCPSRPQCTVRVKLLQRSVSSLLRFAACEDGVIF
ncbi:DNA repair-scaffolding protein isoform X5 [Neophocaena asiaeorientalis asiaeorientalis]|uniref:DNA repair-scaffolding protein isoform X5 n=1 Tax=Neophocaena asiaeorientalis asiaeorientalis TaxID=1706337 RepID=A0A341B9N1_NEOAA|nr:DNA repair-scaffolding protein isoform X5 [Neophocaena asiaeorientalis asiaeorientalis]XP_024598369.1 DNA repair-scaffolding protein isoform X5 [Neophocaena asiaeorientalis asiaeorientalis]